MHTVVDCTTSTCRKVLLIGHSMLSVDAVGSQNVMPLANYHVVIQTTHVRSALLTNNMNMNSWTVFTANGASTTVQTVLSKPGEAFTRTIQTDVPKFIWLSTIEISSSSFSI